ncbi:hypothetical protein SEVIR_1G324100v4 [Setaria viridis]
MASPSLKSHSPVAAALHSARRADLHGRGPVTVHVPSSFTSMFQHFFQFSCRLFTCSGAVSLQLGRFHDRGFRSSNSKRSAKVSAFPSLDMVPLMATMVDHVNMSRDYVVTKSIWHLSDTALKSVYTFYAMFTVWGVCFFASMKDPFYDSDTYRSQGGDGTVHWYYDKVKHAGRIKLSLE